MIFIFLALFLLNSEVLCTNAAADTLEKSELEQYNGVEYLTYTKDNRTNAVDIRDVKFDDDYANVFVIHGFEAKSIKNALQVKDDLFQFNLNVGRIIIVSWLDYSHGSASSLFKAPTSYHKVVQYHVPRLARDVHEKIAYIQKKGAQGAIKIVGHCIGAHVAGQTGKLMKNETGDTLDEIFALDPTGLYFEDNLDEALQTGDAKEIVILHTSNADYCFKSAIGPNVKNVNCSTTQMNCKINVDFCSHNEAWNSYSLFLEKKLVTADKVRMHPYVICLDVSYSMNTNKRLERAVNSAQKVISKIKPGSYMGIVQFNSKAKKVHDVIQIKGLEEKKSLETSLPHEANGATSIGSGLRFSMNMLQALPNSTTFCSTIILISDGEQVTGETPNDVLPDLQKTCIAVSSIGIGESASKELEGISANTSGLVSYAMEDGTSNDIVGTIRALSYLFESEMDQPLRLLSKEVTLSDGEENIQFIVDDTNGKDTEFNIVSYDAAKVDVKLTSPEGDTYSSKSPEYFYDHLTEKGFRIPYAEPGQWTLTISTISKSKRSIRSTYSVSVVATTHQLDNKSTIRLNAVISDRILEYPKAVTITAELKIEEYPVINAEVYANIEAPHQPIIRLPLQDNGIFPDELANDGIYTNDVIKLPNPERYTVTVKAQSNGNAMMVPKKINYFFKEAISCKNISCTKLSPFQREADVGSIKLISPNAMQDQIRPHPVSDLLAIIKNFEERIILLKWTSPPSNEFYDIQIKNYDIRVLANGTDFENGFKYFTNKRAKSTQNAANSKGKKEKISIHVPKAVWDYVVRNTRPEYQPELKIVMKLIGVNGQVSAVSNIASVVVKTEGL